MMRLKIDPIFPTEGTVDGYVLGFNSASPDLLAWVPQAAGTGGTGGASLADSTPSPVGTAGSPGNSGSASRSNHVHAHGTFASGNYHTEYSGTGHTHTPDHAAVTLQASSTSILDLSGQAIGFDSQSANTILAAPISGAGTPQFRTLGTADLPTIPHSFISSVGADDHHALQHALAGSAHTGQLPFGSVSGSITAAQHGTFVSDNLHPEYSGTAHAHGTVAAHDHTSADNSGVLTNDEHDGYTQMLAIATPSNPSANNIRIFPRVNGLNIELVMLSALGNECIICTLPNTAHTNRLTLNWIE
jgi:hypothetical protein